MFFFQDCSLTFPVPFLDFQGMFWNFMFTRTQRTPRRAHAHTAYMLPPLSVRFVVMSCARARSLLRGWWLDNYVAEDFRDRCYEVLGVWLLCLLCSVCHFFALRAQKHPTLPNRIWKKWNSKSKNHFFLSFFLSMPTLQLHAYKKHAHPHAGATRIANKRCLRWNCRKSCLSIRFNETPPKKVCQTWIVDWRVNCFLGQVQGFLPFIGHWQCSFKTIFWRVSC